MRRSDFGFIIKLFLSWRGLLFAFAFLATLISCILPLILGSIYIKVNLQKELFSKNIEEATSLLEQTGKHVDAVIIDQTQQLIRLMNQEPRLTNVGDDIRSYVDYDGMSSGESLSFGEKELMLY